MYDVFLSHGHEDSEEVERLAAHLEDDYGFSIWLDRWILIPGEPWVQKIEKGFAQAKSCAVCLGARTPDGWFRDEVDLALDRQNKDPSFRVIPTILASGSRELVAGFLKLRDWADFSEDSSWALHLLASGIRGEPPGRRPAKPGRLAATRQRLTELDSLGDVLLPEIRLEAQRRIVFEWLEKVEDRDE